MKRVCAFLIVFVFCCSKVFSSTNHQWILIMTKPSHTNAETWQEYSKPDVKDILYRYKNGYVVTAITFGNEKWIYTYSKSRIYRSQHVEIFSKLCRKKINVYLKRGYAITEAEFGLHEWNVVFSKYKPYKDQKVLIKKEYPEEEIKAFLDKGYKLTNIGRDDDEWLVVLSHTRDILEQQVVKRNYFPENEIADWWNKGMIISRLKFIDNAWYLVMSKYTSNISQAWRADNKFPEDEVTKLWDQNYRITEFSYGCFTPIQQLSISDTKLSNVYSPQKNSNWCWAANVQMVLNYYGISKDQGSIVKSMYGCDEDGNLPNSLASDGQITRLLSVSSTFDNEGNICTITPSYSGGFPSDSIIINNLKSSHPIVFAYYSTPPIGHVCLLTGIHYVMDIDGNMQILDIILSDPDAKTNCGRVVWRKKILEEKKKCFWTVKLIRQPQIKDNLPLNTNTAMN